MWPMPELMRGQTGATASVPLLGVSLGAFAVMVIALVSQPRRCAGPDWLGWLIWSCVAVGSLSAFLAPLVGGDLRGSRVAGRSFLAGLALAALWILASLVVGFSFAGRAGCFD